MSKINKVIACIQILIFLCLILCSGGVTISLSGKSGAFPCKDHACGCKSEADCKTHCCCSPQGNPSASQYGVKKRKDSLQSFISSLRCKSGNDTIACINAELKYVLEGYFVIPPITFFWFLAGDILAHIREVMVSPPEKPPRGHA